MGNEVLKSLLLNIFCSVICASLFNNQFIIFQQYINSLNPFYIDLVIYFFKHIIYTIYLFDFKVIYKNIYQAYSLTRSYFQQCIFIIAELFITGWIFKALFCFLLFYLKNRRCFSNKIKKQ